MIFEKALPCISWRCPTVQKSERAPHARPNMRCTESILRFRSRHLRHNNDRSVGRGFEKSLEAYMTSFDLRKLQTCWVIDRLSVLSSREQLFGSKRICNPLKAPHSWRWYVLFDKSDAHLHSSCDFSPIVDANLEH